MANMKAAILLLLAAACGDNLSAGPRCPADSADRHAACQLECKPSSGPGSVCPGATTEACIVECEACEPGNAWCPGPLPACSALCGDFAFCNADRSACSCIPPGEVAAVACDGQPDGGR